jgi:hypothetical protein
MMFILTAAGFAACSGDDGTTTESGAVSSSADAASSGAQAGSSSSSGMSGTGGGAGTGSSAGGMGGAGGGGGMPGVGGAGGAGGMPGVGGAGGMPGVGGAGGMVGVGGAGGMPGVGGAGGAPGTGGSGGGSAQDCQACAQTSCLAELSNCQANAACSPWLTCIQGCQDAACSDMCDQQYANAKPLYDSVYACTCASCMTECSVFDTCNKGGNAQDCTTCAQNNCLTELSNCQADMACSPWLTCILGCQDEACTDVCDQQYPNAKPLYDPVYACTCSSCMTECSVFDTCNKGGSAQDCTTCATNNCAAEFFACQTNAACAPWLTCIQQCQDAACADMCDQQYPNAQPFYTPAYACACAECMTDCAALDPCN